MENSWEFIIGGKKRKSEQKREVRFPYTQELVAEVFLASDRDIDEAVFAGEGDGGLAAEHGERVKAGAAAAAEDEAEDLLLHGRPFIRCKTPGGAGAWF